MASNPAWSGDRSPNTRYGQVTGSFSRSVLKYCSPSDSDRRVLRHKPVAARQLKPGSNGAFQPFSSLNGSRTPRRLSFPEHDSLEQPRKTDDPRPVRIPGISRRSDDRSHGSPREVGGPISRSSDNLVSGPSEFSSVESMMYPGKTRAMNKSTWPLSASRHERNGSIPYKRGQDPSEMSDLRLAKRLRSPRSNESERLATPSEDPRDPGFSPVPPKRPTLSRGPLVAPNSATRRAKRVRPDLECKLKSFATNITRVTDPELCMTSHGTDGKDGSFVFHWSKNEACVKKDQINKVLFSPAGQSPFVYFEGQRKEKELKRWYLAFESAEDTMGLANLIQKHCRSITLVERNP
jgi:hypothetical protein